jgi:FkbM family methyltransferase
MNDLGRHVDAFAKLEDWTGAVPDGSVANFLGVLTNESYLARHSPSNSIVAMGGTNATASVPAVSDGEPFFEFASLYDAVLAAKDRFTMVELGGGYASRCVDAQAALRRYNPLPASFVVVEAEPVHFEWAKRHMRANGIDPDEHWLINAAVSDSADPVLFLVGEGLYYNCIVTAKDAVDLCSEIEGIGKLQSALRNMMSTGQLGIEIPFTSKAGRHIHDMKYVSARPLADVLQPLDTVDLLDVDIQGAEIMVLPPAISALNAKVKRLHLGTHGLEVHKFMWDMFFEAEWLCEYDYPPASEIETEWGNFSTSDGILAFVNPRL